MATGSILHVGATVMCTHGAQANAVPSNTRVLVSNQPVTVVPDTYRWLSASLQTKVGGTSVLLQTSIGLCYSAEQIPQGSPSVASVQMRVKGT